MMGPEYGLLLLAVLVVLHGDGRVRIETPRNKKNDQTSRGQGRVGCAVALCMQESSGGWLVA